MLNDQNNRVMDQSIPAAPSAPPPPPPGYCRAFARLVSPGGGAFANFVLLGGWEFANPAAIPELLTRTRFPIRINYITTQRILLGKKTHWLKLHVKACS